MHSVERRIYVNSQYKHELDVCLSLLKWENKLTSLINRIIWKAQLMPFTQENAVEMHIVGKVP